MKKAEKFDNNDIFSYVNKSPVVVNGNPDTSFKDYIPAFEVCRRMHRRSFSAQDSDILLFPGKPYSFDKVTPIILTEDQHQNILVFCDYFHENARYLSEIAASMIRSAHIVGLSSEIWGPSNDICLRHPNTQLYWEQSSVFSDTASLSVHIHELKKQLEVAHRIIKPQLIMVFNLFKLLNQMGQKKDSASALRTSIKNPFGAKRDASEIISSRFKDNTSIQDEYNPVSDLKFLLENGPEFGLHFIINIDSMASLKKVGISETEFNHVLAFKMNYADAYSITDNYWKHAQNLEEGEFLYTDRRNICFLIHYDNSDIIAKGD